MIAGLSTTLYKIGALLSLAMPMVAAAAEIRVDCGVEVVTQPEKLRFGACVNYLIASDRYDKNRKHGIRDSLRALNVKAIRWNEGEIGDKMIWSIPPFEKPDAHATHIRMPGTPHSKWRVDENGKFTHPVMELDEAIAVARDLKLELFIIVGIDAIWVEEPSVRGKDTKGELDPVGTIEKRMTDYDWALKGQSPRQMITASTIALSKYLASEASDLVVFMEIGNENYLGKANWKPERYAEIVNDLSKQIKKVNPKLKVGAQLAHQANWTSIAEDGRSWNQVMREELEFQRIDHLIVHQYGFEDTKNVNSAVEFLNGLPDKNRQRIDITVTELGTWHTPGSKQRWGPNDLLRSIYQFRWLGMIQTNGKGTIRTPLFWTTRWLDMLRRGPYGESFNALDLDGNVIASGMALKIWNDFVQETLVKVETSGAAKDLYCYASMSRSDPAKLAVWIANSHAEERTVSLEVQNFAEGQLRSKYTYSGKGPTDTHPTLKQNTTLPLPGKQGSFELTLAPYSIQVLCFGGGRPSLTKNF